MYRVNRPLTSVLAALLLLGGLLLVQHYWDRAPGASLSALPTATAESRPLGASEPPSTTSPAPVDPGMESTMASDAIGAAGGQ
jgi:hypothetical protein